eukprot:8989427-Ditylum_brightwellii.AAC.1
MRSNTEVGTDNMKWLRSSNKNKPFFSAVTLDFVCQSVLPLLKDPSHVQDSSQLNSVWFDWALFALDRTQIPCQ